MLKRSGLGYAELRNALRQAYRNSRKWRRCRDIHRRLLEACVQFAKNGSRIINEMVLARLHVALRELRITNLRTRIIVEGEIKASEMQTQLMKQNVFNWVPQLRKWLKDEGYRFWLGTMQISSETYQGLTYPG